MDAISVASIFNDATKKQPEKPATVVAEGAYDEEKFYDSSHNWNNTKSTKVEKIKISSEPTHKEVKKTEQEKEVKNQWSIPLPLIMVAVLSGLMYLISVFRMRNSNE